MTFAEYKGSEPENVQLSEEELGVFKLPTYFPNFSSLTFWAVISLWYDVQKSQAI